MILSSRSADGSTFASFITYHSSKRTIYSLKGNIGISQKIIISVMLVGFNETSEEFWRKTYLSGEFYYSETLI